LRFFNLRAVPGLILLAPWGNDRDKRIMDTTDNIDVIAAAQPTQARRALAFSALVGLGCLVIYIALFQDGSLRAKVLLVGLGGCALWGADHMRRATAARVELTTEGLRDSDGTQIVALGDILRVERGALAFKPSNGFMVHTSVSQPRGWRMGSWWRFGKHVGIGGMMPAHQTKLMAEKLAAMIDGRP